MAYRLLADMRIALFAKLDALAPAYLLRRRSGDLVGLATQDVETIEYFFAHTLTPAIVAVLMPAAVLAALAVSPGRRARARCRSCCTSASDRRFFVRRASTGSAPRAREGLGRLTAHVADTIQGLSELVAFQAVDRRRAEFMQIVGDYHALRLELLSRSSAQTAPLEVATGLGGLAVAITGASLAADRRLDPTCCRS